MNKNHSPRSSLVTLGKSYRADLVFYNGRLITMEPNQPYAQAIAIRGDKIVAVGSNHEIRALAGLNAQVINLGGRTLVPGFIDSHAHWIGCNEWTGYSKVDETIQYLLENGWTSINEMFVSQDRLEALQTLDLEGRLKVRVNAYLPVNYRDQRFGRPYEAYTPRQVISPHVCTAGVKFFIDNEWGHTIHWQQSELTTEAVAAHQAGWQVAIHNEMIETAPQVSWQVGIQNEMIKNTPQAGLKEGIHPQHPQRFDAHHSLVLEALAEALAGEDNRAYRHRIEHVFGVTDRHLEVIRQQGYIASIQLNVPSNIPDVDPTFYDKVPEENLPLVARWKDLYDAGVLIAGSTDWPWFTNYTFVEQGRAPAGSPLRLIYKAATHTNTRDVIPDDWMDGQYLPVGVALQALTINGAYATFEERVKGSLAPGKWADIVILSDDPITVAETDIAAVNDIEVLMTMIGGKVEYCAPGAVGLCPQTKV
jgi:predicted amidohydrolase YtcJ